MTEQTQLATPKETKHAESQLSELLESPLHLPLFPELSDAAYQIRTSSVLKTLQSPFIVKEGVIYVAGSKEFVSGGLQ